MTVVVVDQGDGNAEYASEDSVPVTYVDSDCIASLPPVTTPVQVIPPTPPPTELPRTGLSTFETGMRMGALLLIGGLGFVIVSRRRRFSAAATAA